VARWHKEQSKIKEIVNGLKWYTNCSEYLEMWRVSGKFGNSWIDTLTLSQSGWHRATSQSLDRQGSRRLEEASVPKDSPDSWSWLALQLVSNKLRGKDVGFRAKKSKVRTQLLFMPSWLTPSPRKLRRKVHVIDLSCLFLVDSKLSDCVTLLQSKNLLIPRMSTFLHILSRSLNFNHSRMFNSFCLCYLVFAPTYVVDLLSAATNTTVIRSW
jgi:hypothetical protein